MESILCTGHKKTCLLKTGTKSGPNFGRSFYICSQEQGRCSFAKDAGDLGIYDCPQHDGCSIELQCIGMRDSTDKRINYRCTLAREKGKTWCGSFKSTSGAKPRRRDDHSSNDQKVMVAKSDINAKDDWLCQVKESKKAAKPKNAEDLDSSVVAFASLGKHPQSKQLLQVQREKNKSLSDSHMSYRENSVLANSDSDEEGYEDASDVGMQSPITLPNAHKSLMDYQDVSRNTIPSDEDSDEEVTKAKRKDNDVWESGDDYLSAESEDDIVAGSVLSGVKFGISRKLKKSLSPEPVGAFIVADSESEDDCVITGEEISPTAKSPSTSKGQVKSEPLTSAPRIQVQSSGPQSSTQQPTKVITIGKTPADHQLSSQQSLPAVKPEPPGGSSTSKPTPLVVQVGSELHKLITGRMEVVKQLESKKILMKSINTSVLPDGGSKIRNQLDELTHRVHQMDIQIRSASKDQLEKESNGIGAPKPQVSMIKPGATGVAGQVLPSSLKQTKLTDHAMVTALPKQVLKQMYADNPQLQSLYGGRMTATRLREVGSVTAEAIERIHKQLDTCPPPTEEFEDPAGLTVPLMPHQRQALAWLTWREQQQPPGGILADDMGLGKTLTMISHIIKRKDAGGKAKEEKSEAWLSREEQIKKMSKGLVKSRATMVVCPASLVHQWHKEIERRCKPRLLKVIVYHGPNRERDINRLARADVVLTTYNIISKEVGIPEGMKKDKQAQDMPASDQDGDVCTPGLMSVAWERIILDEAHSIKNHKSLTAMSVCRLRALYRWALTGTPIQNDLLDMYSLLRFLRCSPFDEFKVWKRQVDNKSDKGTQRLNTLVKSLLLRRTKDQKCKEGKQLVPLPKKSSTTHEMQLSKEEKMVYDRIFQQSRSSLQSYLQRHEDKQQQKGGPSTTSSMSKENNPFSHQSQYNHTAKPPGSSIFKSSSASSGSSSQQTGGTQILLLLLRLRQCCSHLSLMRDSLDLEAMETDGLDLDIVEQMQDLALREQNKLEEPEVSGTKVSALFEAGIKSTKIRALLKEMKAIREESDPENPTKCVIVSQWTRMLTVVDQHLDKAGFSTCTIRGDVLPKKRSELVDTFNCDPEGPTVMLVSLRAGGVGLNLIGGSHLFLIDMHWNPALEQQACDRIYRVGQKREVFIHRFICKDTVEERILALQKAKLDLATNILSGAGASSANKLSLDDLRMLFDLDRPAVPFPADMRSHTGIHPTGFHSSQPNRVLGPRT